MFISTITFIRDKENNKKLSNIIEKTANLLNKKVLKPPSPILSTFQSIEILQKAIKQLKSRQTKKTQRHHLNKQQPNKKQVKH